MIDADERQHLSAQHYLGGPSPDVALQHAVDLTARRFGFPIAALNILDRTDQHTIAAHGTGTFTIPRAHGLCDKVVRSGRPLVATDIHRQWGSTAVCTYIGVPLTGREGLPIAALCLIDSRPREFAADDVQDLAAAATIIQDQLELRRTHSTERAATPARSATISRAIENGEIVPWFQPIVELATEKAVAVEALARWHRADGAIELPASFLANAENSDVIIDLDLAILGTAAASLARWTAEPDLMLNVNLSVRHLEDPTSVDRLITEVAVAGLDPHRVNLEITETTVLEASSRDSSFLQELRHNGFRVWLDDFGTGFSSIGHLLRLPIDGIKLDRTVTKTLGTPIGDAVVRALTQLTHEVNLGLCIEGIESSQQSHQARALGCKQGQGYLWGKPVPATELAALLHQRKLGPDFRTAMLL